MSPTDARLRSRAALPSGVVAIVLTAWGLLAGDASPARAQEGYRIDGNRVLVDRASHWAAWRGAATLIDIVDGGIRPTLQHKDVNAALDAPAFASTDPGGATAASNPHLAALVIDGDTTSWGPDPSSPLRDWWVEINLGRLVVVRRIVVRFAEPGQGDPFLQFRVLGWRGGPPTTTNTAYTLTGTRIPKFWELGRSDRPNKTQRVFEFEPQPTAEANELFAGDALSHIRVLAIASDSSQAEEVTEAAFNALPVSQQGKIEYFRRERSGRETRVSAADYARIDADRQGSMRYYRREMPRIAEIEVITTGDNVNLGLGERDGWAQIETQNEPKNITFAVSDGDYTTSHSGPIFDYREYEFFEDLGALFWVDTMQFLTDGPQPIDRFTLDVSDGQRAPDGSILWTRAGDASVEGTYEETYGSAALLTASEGVRFREFRLVPAKIRFVRTIFRNPLRVLSNIGINEVMVYGHGYVPEIVLTSDLIQFDRPKNLVTIEWQADTPDQTGIQVQTRTGNELDLDTLYFDTNGIQKTSSQFNRLPPSRRGEIRTESRPGGDWSTWSQPYTRSGAGITSPSPRQYMEMRVMLLSEQADTAATLRSITMNTADPVVDGLVGEVVPIRVSGAATAEEFRFYVRPDFASGAQGFDEMLIAASAGTRIDELLGVHAGSGDDFAAGTPTQWPASALQVVDTGDDSLQFRLPQRIGPSFELVEVHFRATIFGNVGSFYAFARDADAAGYWQRVDEGNATDLVASSTVTVLADGAQVIPDLRMTTAVVTPNGDGIHDDIGFLFSVARLEAPTPVWLQVFDLSGRLLDQTVEERIDPRGRYDLRWDGTDRSGRRVPPGIYVARISVDVDAGAAPHTVAQRVVHVAY